MRVRIKDFYGEVSRRGGHGAQMSQFDDVLDGMTIRSGGFNATPSELRPGENGQDASAATRTAPDDVMPEMLGSNAEGEPGTSSLPENYRLITAHPSPESRLVSWTESNSLATEKFRALTVRLGAMRKEYKLNSLQVTSSVVNEGKSFVAANLAVTLSKYSGARTLLIEGDMHRPMLGSMFGWKKLHGLNDWWQRGEQDLARYLFRFSGAPLCFLPAGTLCHDPFEILHSVRFAEAFAELVRPFDWTIVDSTPMLPIIDANLWSELVDGTLLVVREGVTPLKILKNGLQSLDHANLIGVVVNEATEFNQSEYDGKYYGARK